MSIIIHSYSIASKYNKPTLIIMSGVPASGKSTYAKHCQDDYNYKVISRDKIRFSFLKENDSYFKYEKQVFKTFIEQINTHLQNDLSVVADATHLDKISRQKLISNINPKFVGEFIICSIKEELSVLLERNDKRDIKTKVPKKDLIQMYNKFTLPSEREMQEYKQYFEGSK